MPLEFKNNISKAS